MQQAVKTCANFLRYLVCGAARQLFHLFLRPAFCGSQHGLTNVLLCLCGSSHCFCSCFNFCCLVRKGSHCCFVCFSPFLFCGASRCFFLASCLTLFFLGITLRCGLCLPFLNRGRFCIYFPTYFVRRSGWLRASAYIWRGFF